MKNLKVVRIVGWIQLSLSFLLVIATISVFISYRSSLGDMTHSLADSVLSVSDVISKVANTIAVRQELIDDTMEILGSYRKLVADAKSSAQTQGQLLPQYAQNMKDASALAENISKTVTTMGNKMMFQVPTGAQMVGIKPVLVWTQPLAVQANAMITYGQEVKRLSGSLIAIADSINADAMRLNSGFIGASQSTLKMIDDAVKATEKMKSQDLPHAIAGLNATADNLRKASAQANDIGGLAVSLLAAGLVLAVLFAFNSIGVLLIVASLEKVTTKSSTQ